MTVPSVATSIISSLGSTSSILPVFVKDTIGNTGISYIFSKKGGKHEGREKVVEEFGTQAIWLFSIPAIKKAYDATKQYLSGD